MDKLFDNRWAMKIIALLLALTLYLSTNIDNTANQAETTAFPSLSNRDTETITDVSVSAYYDRENLVVSGIPQTVVVTMEGPTSIVKPAAVQREIEVFVNLTDLQIGTHEVPILYQNVSDKLDVIIEPPVANITIHEKVTRDFPVEVDFINRNKIEEGYQPEQPIVKPNIVKVTGAKELIDRIALVKARVDLDGINESIEAESTVTVYDRDGNVLNVEVEPPVVDVSVPITSPYKNVPFRVNRKGTLENNLSITNIEPLTKEITIYGPKNVIDKIEFLDNISIDLSEITETTELEVKVPVPEGVRRVVPETVSIRVEVEREEEKTFPNLSIRSVGLPDNLVLNFLDPETGRLDLTVLGSPTVLADLRSNEMDLYINVTDLGVGEHEVSLEVNGPQNVTWEVSQSTIKVNLTEKE